MKGFLGENMKDRNNQMIMPFPNQFLNQQIPNQQLFPMMPTELENRINSLERMVRRLDARVSKLEGNTGVYNNEYNTSIPDAYNQNMYPNSMHMM